MEELSFSSLNDLLRMIDHRKAEVDALRPFSPEQEGRIMQKFRLDWNYHSNAIEGNSLTYGETIAFLMEGLTAKGKPFKDHLDIKGHNEGIDYLMHFIKNRDQLSEKIIRELHEMILVEPYSNPAQTPDGHKVEKLVTLGKYKTQPNHVKTPTGETHYYATPEETPAKMADLVAWLREHQEKNDLHPLVLAASFHYRFVAIHPFDDGNGRMSRLLMNLLLMQYGYPPVVIKQQDRQAYYYALRQADAGELSTFLEYIGENLLRSLDLQLKGARGESLEEPDDLDKEIALLKVSLGKDEAEPFTMVASRLFRAVNEQCQKLDDLFLGKAENLVLSEDDNLGREIRVEGWDSMEGDWISQLFDDYRATMSLSKITYEYHWINIRSVYEPFSISFGMYFKIHGFNFEIGTYGFNQDIKITKPYSQKLTPEEFTDLSKIFVKEALAQIKARTGK